VKGAGFYWIEAANSKKKDEKQDEKRDEGGELNRSEKH
jgi:hypothetical protein